jgi:TRAP-type C4-dicarboxylate transport system permease small subunit
VKVINSALDWGARLLAGVASIGLLAMLLHVCADVISDYLFNEPIPGTAEIVAYYYMVGAVFLPLPLVELRNDSINVDLFYNLARRAGQRVMLFVSYLAQAAFFGILAWQSGVDFVEALVKGELVEGRINILIWPGRACLPAAFALAAVISVFLLARVLLERGFEPDDLNEDDPDGLREGVA